jgi:membrane protease YdiL (CAAX protease family)
MENALLILTLTTASVGFMIWYSLSSSLRLPFRYQVMYDANPPYVNRVLRRRTLAAILFAGIPMLIIFLTNLIGRPSWHELNISYKWSGEVAMYAGTGAVIVLLYNLVYARTDTNLVIYPEVRVRFWRPNLLIWSTVTWLVYIMAVEFFYRGLLLQSLLNKLDPVPAIAASSALYSLIHYFRLNRLTIASVVWSVTSCFLVLHTDSLWPSVIIHLTLCLSLEWLSIRHHKEMYVRRT